MRCGSRTRRQRPHVVSAPLTPVRPSRTVTRRLNSSTLAARRAPSSQSRGPQHPTALIPFGLPLERSPILPINRRSALTNKVASNFSSPKVSVQKLSFRIGAFETVCCELWRVARRCDGEQTRAGQNRGNDPDRDPHGRFGQMALLHLHGKQTCAERPTRSERKVTA